MTFCVECPPSGTSIGVFRGHIQGKSPCVHRLIAPADRQALNG